VRIPVVVFWHIRELWATFNSEGRRRDWNWLWNILYPPARIPLEHGVCQGTCVGGEGRVSKVLVIVPSVSVRTRDPRIKINNWSANILIACSPWHRPSRLAPLSTRSSAREGSGAGTRLTFDGEPINIEIRRLCLSINRIVASEFNAIEHRALCSELKIEANQDSYPD